jgi:hypothetical protein
MGVLKMKKARKTRAKNKEVRIESGYIIFSLIAAIAGYLSYYLKFPNSYSLLLMLVFSIALLNNFNSRKGISVLIYSLIVNALLLPLNLFALPISTLLQLVFLLINLLLLAVVLIGLKRLRKWGFYLAALVYIFSLLNALFSLFMSLNGVAFALPGCIAVCSILLSNVFLVLAIVYLIKSRGYFK